MPFDRYLKCPNPDCPSPQEPIWLPSANLSQTTGDQKAWPSDGGSLFVACPECRRVSAHCSVQTEDCSEAIRTALRRDKFWIRVSFVCGQENCKTRLEFLALTGKADRKHVDIEVREKLQSGWWSGNLACQHAMRPRANPAFWIEYLSWD